MTELRCWGIGCYGTLEWHGDDEGEILLSCTNCDNQIEQPFIEDLAADDGPLAELATVLLEKRYEDNETYA